MERHGHDHLAMIRMDVESAEWDVLDQWIKQKWFDRFDQLLLEIHLWRSQDERRHSYILDSIPMSLFHKARNNWNGKNIYRGMTQVYEMGWLRGNDAQ